MGRDAHAEGVGQLADAPADPAEAETPIVLPASSGSGVSQKQKSGERAHSPPRTASAWRPAWRHNIMDLKCRDSGECEKNVWDNLTLLKPTDQSKFVIASRRDFDWAVSTIRDHALDARFVVLLGSVFSRVAPRVLAEWLLDSRLNVRMQLQLHKYIREPDARGV